MSFCLNLIFLYPEYFRGFHHLRSMDLCGPSNMSFSFTFLFCCSFILGLKKKQLIFALSVVVVLFLVVRLFFYDWTVQTHFFIPLEPLFDLGPYFLMGSLLSCFDFDTMPAKNAMAAVLSMALVASVYFKVGHTVVYFTLPFLVIYVGKQTSKLATWVHSAIGDPSYGIYLYAFPLQQLLIYWYRPSTLVLFIASTIGAFVFGYLSWIFIEKKALALKQYFLQNRHK